MSALADLHPAAIAVLVVGLALWAYVLYDNIQKLTKKLRGVGGALMAVVFSGGILVLFVTLAVRA